jgi:hypothetical protein
MYEAEVAAIDQWRLSHNMPGRHDAMRELLRLGLLREVLEDAACRRPD